MKQCLSKSKQERNGGTTFEITFDRLKQRSLLSKKWWYTKMEIGDDTTTITITATNTAATKNNTNRNNFNFNVLLKGQ